MIRKNSQVKECSRGNECCAGNQRREGKRRSLPGTVLEAQGAEGWFHPLIFSPFLFLARSHKTGGGLPCGNQCRWINAWLPVCGKSKIKRKKEWTPTTPQRVRARAARGWRREHVYNAGSAVAFILLLALLSAWRGPSRCAHRRRH